MFNYNLSLKKVKESQRTLSKKAAQTRWLKNYHQQIQPRLLQHYDARVNAFIKRIEQKPDKPKEIPNPLQSAQGPAWKFAISSRSATDKKIRVRTTMNDDGYQTSIWRASSYVPLGCHQFRERDKSKQLKSKSTASNIIYKKYKQVRKSALRTQQKVKLGQPISYRKHYEDNRSQIPSIPSVAEDNISLRYSINSEMQNIEKDAMQYQKNQEVVEKKNHFKRLANLQVTVNDKRAKNSIHSLLIKEGKIKEKKNAEKQQVQTDLLKDMFERAGKFDLL